MCFAENIDESLLSLAFFSIGLMLLRLFYVFSEYLNESKLSLAFFWLKLMLLRPNYGFCQVH